MARTIGVVHESRIVVVIQMNIVYETNVMMPLKFKPRGVYSTVVVHDSSVHLVAIGARYGKQNSRYNSNNKLFHTFLYYKNRTKLLLISDKFIKRFDIWTEFRVNHGFIIRAPFMVEDRFY